MSENIFTPEAIAEFLQNNPRFLLENAEIFAQLEVPNPHGPGVLSLLEHQVNTLRQHLRQTQTHLHELGHIAHENTDIVNTIMDWCASLLAQKETELIPAAIVTGLQDAFPDLEVELLLWGLENLEDYQREENQAVHDYVQTLKKPYTGKKIPEAIAAWLSEPASSFAIVPLTVNDEKVGALVFSSQDAEHFYEGMGVDFLETLGLLASSAVSRLASVVMDQDYRVQEEGDEQSEGDNLLEETDTTATEDNDTSYESVGPDTADDDDDYPELSPADSTDHPTK